MSKKYTWDDLKFEDHPVLFCYYSVALVKNEIIGEMGDIYQNVNPPVYCYLNIDDKYSFVIIGGWDCNGDGINTFDVDFRDFINYIKEEFLELTKEEILEKINNLSKEIINE